MTGAMKVVIMNSGSGARAQDVAGPNPPQPGDHRIETYGTHHEIIQYSV